MARLCGGINAVPVASLFSLLCTATGIAAPPAGRDSSLKSAGALAHISKHDAAPPRLVPCSGQCKGLAAEPHPAVHLRWPRHARPERAERGISRRVSAERREIPLPSPCAAPTHRAIPYPRPPPPPPPAPRPRHPPSAARCPSPPPRCRSPRGAVVAAAAVQPAQVTKLPSGLTVVSQDGHGAVASIGLHFAAGSRYEEAAGTTHLLEHAAFSGTNQRTALKLFKDAEDMGGAFSAATSREEVRRPPPSPPPLPPSPPRRAARALPPSLTRAPFFPSPLLARAVRLRRRRAAQQRRGHGRAARRGRHAEQVPLLPH